MRYKITKAEYEALSPEMKLLYVADGDGFKLPLVDYQDPAPLIAARDREKQDAADLRTKVTTLETENKELKKTVPQDIRTLQSAHEAKLREETESRDARINTLRAAHERTLADQAARTLAADMTADAANANVMLPHVSNRIAVEWNGDVAVVKIKNADGSMGSALTPDSGKILQKEFVDNPVFGAIVVKSKASGGSAAGGQVGAPGSAGAGQKKLSEMGDAERTKLYTENPAEFKRLSEEEKQAKRTSFSQPIKPLIQR